jgi:glycosyltransferase involved in cell wall biosynthesis
VNLKVSIIIACYNDPYVVEAVKSANSQTYQNKEIILVDDGSNGEVAEIIQNLKNDVDHILVQENSGQSIARNNGIKKSTGELILNLDSDDLFEPDFCEKAVEVFTTNRNVKIVTCKARRFNINGIIDVFTPRGGSIDDFLFSNSALGSSMFRKADWKEVGGYEENLPILGFEDWELYLNILKSGGQAYVLNEVLFNYRIRKNSTTVRIKNLKQDKFKCIIQKHRELYLDHFDGLLDELFLRIHSSEKQRQKIMERPDYRLGYSILEPLRKLKSMFK